ncbi:MAG: tRNA lysidine(34) synthetase TilS [Butyrivibrio sp.]|nr:tRNA lysidine(34) synthetase TilS [Butyrivibrio sp.]
MIKKIKSFMEKHHMAEPGETIFLGVSGGADSVCLCLILTELCTEMVFRLEVIHVEHGIRGDESRQDALFVKNLCGSLGLICHERQVDVPLYARHHHMGEEEAARILRYRAFKEIAAGSKKAGIALAHHMDDNAETILFQMIRGSGLDGMCGMSPVRTDEEGWQYIRPLLCVGRNEIIGFLKERGQKFCTDSTNDNLAYSRNRIRNRVMPELTSINPKAVMHINREAGYLTELKEYIEAAAEHEYKRLAKREEDGGISLNIGGFTEIPAVLQLRIIHRMLAAAAGFRKDIAAVHLEAVRGLCYKQTGSGVDLPYGLMAKRSYGHILVSRKACGENKPFLSMELTGEQLGQLKDSAGNSLDIRLGNVVLTCRIFPFDGNFDKIPQNMYTKWFDYDMIKNGIFIRNRKKGDFFLLDKKGRRKKIKDYFVDEKIPADSRKELILLAKESQILWIAGGRMGYGAEITENTRTVFEVAYTKEEISDGKQTDS